jgi:CRISPR-associated endonuclease/helicase Cas3
LAARFVGQFADTRYGEILGLWHDIGKATASWQAFIGKAMGGGNPGDGRELKGPPHAPVGAIAAARWQPTSWLGYSLALAISGHHGGIPDRETVREQVRNAEHVRRYEEVQHSFHPPASAFPVPDWLAGRPDPRRIEMFTRFLFSALVDADFLDTEAYAASTHGREAEEKVLARSLAWPELSSYDETLDAFMADKQQSTPDTVVNRLRRRVLEDCVGASDGPRGAYSLTVPTGGGKTLAGLSFAIKHALRSGQRRVVIALPFTAIIDQTVDVLRGVFGHLGPEVVLEHHSAVDPTEETPATRVASENWDVPLVVTTQVQIFESLFSNRPSKCRKLHNLVNSVIVLDEVQSLPHGVLAPILDVLDDLVAHYGVTLLLTTATQPSLHTRPLGGAEFRGLSPPPREIVSEVLREDLWNGLRRVEVVWPERQGSSVAKDGDGFWTVLAEELASHERVLAIVHLKKDAQTLHSALRSLCPDAMHLSAAMCPAHRRGQLQHVRSRLSSGATCRLVSTQVIEAGVDVDFPVVYRAMAGLESLAQSAGRCNREGRLEGLGRFRVFEAPTRPPQSLRLHRDIAESMLMADEGLDLFVPATFARYFDRVYASRDLDSRHVQDLRRELNFVRTAQAFRMIDDTAESVFVHWNDEARRLIAELRRFGPSRRLLRRLQQFSVAVYPRQRTALERQSALEDVNGYMVLADFEPSVFYRDDVGLVTEADTSMDIIA